MPRCCTDEKLRETFETYWSVPGQSAEDRMKLLNLAWDLLGSDFAGRHMQYEKFYAGPGFVMNGYSYLTAPWDEWAGRWTNCWRATIYRTKATRAEETPMPAEATQALAEFAASLNYDADPRAGARALQEPAARRARLRARRPPGRGNRTDGGARRGAGAIARKRA